MKDMGVKRKQMVAAVSNDLNTMQKYWWLLEEKWPLIIVSAIGL